MDFGSGAQSSRGCVSGARIVLAGSAFEELDVLQNGKLRLQASQVKLANVECGLAVGLGDLEDDGWLCCGDKTQPVVELEPAGLILRGTFRSELGQLRLGLVVDPADGSTVLDIAHDSQELHASPMLWIRGIVSQRISVRSRSAEASRSVLIGFDIASLEGAF